MKNGKIIRKTVAFLSALLLITSIAPVQPVSTMFENTVITANAAENISYISHGWNGTQVTSETLTCSSYTTISGNTTNWTNGWYVVPKNTTVTISNRIIVTGTINLILCDGATLNAQSGIKCGDDNALNIYGQTNNTGKLIATANGHSISPQVGGALAGIGGDDGQQGGNITVYGGDITAKSNLSGHSGAGIGGGCMGDGTGGTFTMYAGKVDAFSSWGAGIGGGCMKAAGKIVIYGGEITANGVCGIGSGLNLDNGKPSDISIYGGDITLTGTECAIKVEKPEHIKLGSVKVKNGSNYVGSADRLSTCQNNKSVKIETCTTFHDYNHNETEHWCTCRYCGEIRSPHTVEGDTCGICGYAKTDVSLFISVSNWEYTPNPNPIITTRIKMSTDTGMVELSEEGKIEYKVKGADDKTYTTTVPTDVGEYTARWSVASTSSHKSGTATNDFKIQKADARYTKSPGIPNRLVYNGSEQDLLIAGSTSCGTILYAVSDTKPTNDNAWSETIPKETTAKKSYTVWYKIKGDKNHKDSEPESVSVPIEQANSVIEIKANSSLKYTGKAQDLITFNLKTGDNLYYFAVTDANITEAPQTGWETKIPSRTEVGTYKVWYKAAATTNYLDTKPTAMGNITIDQADLKIETAPTASAITYGKSLSDSTLSGGKVTFDGTEISGSFAWEDSNIVSSVADSDKTSYKVIFTPEDTQKYNSAECYVTLKVNKANMPANSYTIPTAVDKLTYSGSAQTLINKGSAEYGTIYYALGEETSYPTDKTAWTTDESKITGTNAGNYYVWYKIVDAGNYEDTTPAMITVNIAQAKPTITSLNASAIEYGHSLSNSTLEGSASFNGTNVTGSFVWTDATIKPSVADSNTTKYKVTFRPDDTTNYTPCEAEVVLTVSAINATCQVPSAKTLTYDGSPQELITAGSATGGIIKYSIGTETSAGETWTENASDITGTDADTYYVWYKVEGDENHNDADPVCIPVTIGQDTPSITFIPATDLKYNRNAQTLATINKKTGDNIYQFAVTDATVTEAPENGWENTIPTVTNVGTYKIWYKAEETQNYFAVSPQSFAQTISIEQATPVISTIPTVSAITYGEQLKNSKISNGVATLDGTQVTGTFIWQSGEGYPEVKDSEKTEYIIEFKPDDTTNYTSSTCKVTLKVNKADTTYTAPQANTLTYNTNEQYLITSGSSSDGKVKYALGKKDNAPTDVNAWTEDVNKITATDADTYYVWYKVDGDANHNNITPIPITVNIAQAALTVKNLPSASEITYGQKLNSSTLSGGKVTFNGTEISGSFAWIDATIQPSVLDSNFTKYNITFTPQDTKNYKKATCDVTLKINKATMVKDTDYTAPVMQTPTYTGKEQELIKTAGTFLAGTTMQYALTESTVKDAPVDEDAWTDNATDIKAKNVGTYKIWYKVNGGDNYQNVDPEALTVKIQSNKSNQNFTVSLPSYPYDGTAHQPQIIGKAYGELHYYYYKADSKGNIIEKLSEPPTEPGNYVVEAFAYATENYNYRIVKTSYSIFESAKYHLSVKNGTVNGETSGEFNENTLITVMSNKPEKGKKFGYWTKNGSAEAISYNPSYTFKINSDTQLEAVYLDADDEFKADGRCMKDSIDIDKANRKISFSFLNNVPKNCTMMKCGVVATSDMKQANALSLTNAMFVKEYQTTAYNCKYTWTKSEIADGQAWYVKGYLIYKDKTGKEITVYSHMEKATLNGSQTILEEKILGTAMMSSVKSYKNKDASKGTCIDFVSLLTVPADCKIKFAGVVATSDVNKKANLIKINATERTEIDNCFVRGTASSKHTVQFTWTKTNVGKETWYVRPYLVYTDTLGKEQVVYGELTTKKLN